MNALTLQWHDAGQDKTQNIYEQQPSKNPGTVRIGRDPQRCDIVLSNPTVSGLHTEIFFHAQQQCFYIRNLRSQNPPLVNGQQLVQGERPLTEGTVIYLGQLKLQVTSVSVNSIPVTILSPPHSPVGNPYPTKPPVYQQQRVQPVHHHHHHHQHQAPGIYDLECPRCHKVSPIENLNTGCPWCGTSLAAAISVLRST